MEEIYELESLELDDEGNSVKKFKKVKEDKATHKHKCYHDEGKNRPCRRVKI